MKNRTYQDRILPWLTVLLLECTCLTGCASRTDDFFSQDRAAEEALEEAGEGTEEAPQEEAVQAEATEMTDSTQAEAAETTGSTQADTSEDDAADEAQRAAADSAQSDNTDGQQEADAAVDLPEEAAQIYVDVSGAVEQPGVYCLAEGSRVFQAIEAAGGCTPEGEISCLNQAAGLTDGQKIYVPTAEELEEAGSGNLAANLVAQGSWSFQGQDAGGTGQQSQDGAQTDGNDSGKINLNTADEAALTTLPGIGSSKAEAILAYRQAHGSFAAIEDVMNVEGIKEGVFNKIKDRISIE